MPLTREEAARIYDAGKEAVVDLLVRLSEEIELLRFRVQQLENQLAKDSHNSNKPPSSDGLEKKKRTKSLRKNSGRSPGGQEGHKGCTLKMVDTPDHIVLHRIKGRCHCSRSMRYKKPAGYERRQVFDLPEIKIEVTEYRAEIKQCDCGARHVADFPDGVDSPVQYGKRIKSNAVYLMNYQHLPYGRTQETIRDLFNHEISQATLFNFKKSCYDLLEDTDDVIKERIIHSEVANFDETGIPINGDNNWLHSASTEHYTYYACHEKRGKIAMDDIGILPKFTGTAMHDFWKSYMKYSCHHALCGAHHLRNLQYIFEQYGQSWAEEMQKLLCEIKEKVELEKQKSDCLDKQTIRDFECLYQKILISGYLANPPPEQKGKKRRRGRPKKSEPLNLLDRFRDFSRETLEFMYDFNVPFDNNLAERDLRMMKLQQKISGTFRSKEGADMFCRIRGYISTIKKQNMNVLNATISVFEGKPLVA